MVTGAIGSFRLQVKMANENRYDATTRVNRKRRIAEITHGRLINKLQSLFMATYAVLNHVDNNT